MKRTQYSPHFIPIETEQALTFSVSSPLHTHSLHLPFHLPDKLFLKYDAMSRHVCVSQLDPHLLVLFDLIILTVTSEEGNIQKHKE